MNDEIKYGTIKSVIFVSIAVSSIVTIIMLSLLFIVIKYDEDGPKESYQVIESQNVIHFLELPSNGSELRINETEIAQEMVWLDQIDEIGIEHPLAERYRDIDVTPYDIDLMAAVVHHESNNQCFAGQRMVAEVILNRVVQGDMGGTTICDVIYGKNQFFYVISEDIARANETNYQAVYAALNETPITDEYVVYFARSPHNNSVFAKVGDNYFCRKW